MNDDQIFIAVSVIALVLVIILMHVANAFASARKKKKALRRVKEFQQKIRANASPHGQLHDPWCVNPQEDKYFRDKL